MHATNLKPDHVLRLKLAAQLVGTLVHPPYSVEAVKDRLPDALVLADALIALQLAQLEAEDKALRERMAQAMAPLRA